VLPDDGPGDPSSYAAAAAKHQIGAISDGSTVTVLVRTTGNELWARDGSGDSFQAWEEAGGGIYSRPAPVYFGANLWVFYRDSGDHLQYVARNGGVWESPVSLGGTFQGSPVAAVDDAGHVVVAVVTSSGSIWTKILTGDTWGAWTQVPGVLSGSSQLAIATYDGDVYLGGVNGSGRTYVTHYDRSTETWAGWTNLAGVLTNEVTMADYGGLLWVMGVNPNKASYHRTFNGSTWTGWTNIGGSLGPRPSVAGTSGSLLYLGNQTTGRLYAREYDGSWASWQFQSSSLATGPKAVAHGSQAYAFSTDTTGRLVVRRWTGASWTSATILGGGLAVGD
jgi:hypothetical protein